MVQTENIDPTALGLYAVAIVSLPLAMINLWTDGPATNLGLYFPFLGLVIILCGIFAYKGNSLFGFVVLMVAGSAVFLAGTGLDAWSYISFGLVFLVLVVWSIQSKTPKLLTAVLVTTTLIFIISGMMDPNLVGVSDALKIGLGVIAVFNFIECFWLATAIASEGKILPVI